MSAPRWTDAETDLVLANLDKTPTVISTLLASEGFDRTCSSVGHHLDKLGVDRGERIRPYTDAETSFLLTTLDMSMNESCRAFRAAGFKRSDRGIKSFRSKLRKAVTTPELTWPSMRNAGWEEEARRAQDANYWKAYLRGLQEHYLDLACAA
jgi:hypothetical protein